MLCLLFVLRVILACVCVLFLFFLCVVCLFVQEKNVSCFRFGCSWVSTCLCVCLLGAPCMLHVLCFCVFLFSSFPLLFYCFFVCLGRVVWFMWFRCVCVCCFLFAAFLLCVCVLGGVLMICVVFVVCFACMFLFVFVCGFFLVCLLFACACFFLKKSRCVMCVCLCDCTCLRVCLLVGGACLNNRFVFLFLS